MNESLEFNEMGHMVNNFMSDPSKICIKNECKQMWDWTMCYRKEAEKPIICMDE